MRLLEPGVRVRVRLPGRRSFEAVLTAVDAEAGTVNLSDPRNGGCRTIAADRVTIVRRRKSRETS